MGIEHNDGLARALLEIVERRDEVGIAGDEHDAVEVGFDVVDEHLGGDVNVGAFFFGFPHGCARNLITGFAWFLRKGITGAETLVVAFDAFQFWTILRENRSNP